MDKVWKTIPILDGNYEVSNDGCVRSKDKYVEKFSFLCGKNVKQFYQGKELKRTPSREGYLYVRVGHKRKKYSFQVGRLVLMAFCGMPKDGDECCHNDGNPSNNNVDNLRWDSHLNNNKDKVKHGTYKTGENHHFSKHHSFVKEAISLNLIDKKTALLLGVSNTHYYRLKKNKHEANFGTERNLLAQVNELLKVAA